MDSTEETRLVLLRQQASEADARAAQARERLVDAKLEARPETVQKPLVQAVVEAEAQASASHAAVGQQERLFEEMRAEQARRDHEEAVNGLEAELAQVRDDYGAAFAVFEREMRAAEAAFGRMADARSLELSVAVRLARLEGDTSPMAFARYQRIPMPPNSQSQGGRLSDPFTAAGSERIIRAYRMR